MSKRLIFRQFDHRDLGTFLADGEVRSRNHPNRQACHQASHPGIVSKRGDPAFQMPGGGNVNDFVPFYFSPLTSYAYALHANPDVRLIGPDGADLGNPRISDRAFLVADPMRIAGMALDFGFSNVALNKRAPIPKIETNINMLETTVNWSLFDERPRAAQISELSYGGVCKYFTDSDKEDRWRNRKAERMAEFLVRNAVPMSAFECVVAQNDAAATQAMFTIQQSSYNIPVYTKPGCFFG